MRLSCQQEQLHRGLSAVARAIPARTTLPLTQHILFDHIFYDSYILISYTINIFSFLRRKIFSYLI